MSKTTKHPLCYDPLCIEHHPETAQTVTCRRCGAVVKNGIALTPKIYGSEDFGGDYGADGTTRSEGPGDGKPKACLKCPSCGHSFIPPRNR